MNGNRWPTNIACVPWVIKAASAACLCSGLLLGCSEGPPSAAPPASGPAPVVAVDPPAPEASVTVPNVLRIPFEDAAASLQSAGLLFQTSSTSDAKQTDGHVLTQDPKAGSQAPRGSTVALQVNERQSLDGKVIVLQADTGKFLGRCNGCIPGGAYPDAAFIHVTNDAQPWARFSVKQLPNGKYTLKADSGKYLGRCNGCIPGGANPDAAFMHVANSAEPWAQFSVQKLANGKYTLQADTGKFLARCNGCIPGGANPDAAFIHAASSAAAHAQWKILVK
jgi:hypothetical protein